MDQAENSSQQRQSPRQQSSILYKNRAGWSDVKPIYPSDEENDAVLIATSEECKQSGN
jgi:hypothetical protein